MAESLTRLKRLADGDGGAVEPKAKFRRRHLEDSYYWINSYQERAKLTRFFNPTKNVSNFSFPVFDEILPRSVKLFTCYPESDRHEAVCNSFEVDPSFDPITEEEFKVRLTNTLGDTFDDQICIENEAWEKMFQIIEGKKYEMVKGRWKATGEEATEDFTDVGLLLLLSRLHLALKCNMTDGYANRFIGALLDCVQDVGKVDKMQMDHESPVMDSGTNGKINFVSTSDKSSWECGLAEPRSPSAASLTSSLDGGGDVPLFCNPESHSVVPDHIWYMQDYPGYFALNVESKRYEDNLSSSRMQCVRQMFTQIHFQMSSFGLMIGPDSWHIMLLVKSDKTISVHKLEKSLKEATKGFPDCYSFSVKNLKSLCNWLYRIMLYRLKSPHG